MTIEQARAVLLRAFAVAADAELPAEWLELIHLAVTQETPHVHTR